MNTMSTPDTPAPQWQPIIADNQPVFPCWLHRCTEGNDYWFHAEKKPAWLPERDYDLWAVGEQPPDDQPIAPTAQPEGDECGPINPGAGLRVPASGTPLANILQRLANTPQQIPLSEWSDFVNTVLGNERDLNAARAEVERLTRERDEAQGDAIMKGAACASLRLSLNDLLAQLAALRGLLERSEKTIRELTNVGDGPSSLNDTSELRDRWDAAVESGHAITTAIRARLATERKEDGKS